MAKPIHTIRKDQDGIICVSVSGNMGAAEAKLYVADLEPYLSAATVENPLLILVDTVETGMGSWDARQIMIEMLKDRRMKTAVYNVKPIIRTMIELAIRLTRMDTIRIFDTGAEARAWLLEYRDEV